METIQTLEDKMRKKLALCPKCMELRVMTTHHVFPKRHFGKKDKEYRLDICRNCHDEIERILPFRELRKEEYLEIHRRWLKDERILITG